MIGNILVGLVALIHCYIVYLEMVLWDTPRGHKACTGGGGSSSPGRVGL